MHVQVKYCLLGTRLEPPVQTMGQSNVTEHLQSRYGRLNLDSGTVQEATKVGLDPRQVVQCLTVHPTRQVPPGTQGQGAHPWGRAAKHAGSWSRGSRHGN